MAVIRRIIWHGPSLDQTMRQAIRQFLPRAGERVMRRAQSKLGAYQPGWPPLAQSTLERKAKSWKRWRRSGGKLGLEQKGQFIGPISSVGTPLIDTGEMGRSGQHTETDTESRISFAFPAIIHEQDPEIERIDTGSRHTPPRRDFLVRSLDECMPELIGELEALAASMV